MSQMIEQQIQQYLEKPQPQPIHTLLIQLIEQHINIKQIFNVVQKQLVLGSQQQQECCLELMQQIVDGCFKAGLEFGTVNDSLLVYGFFCSQLQNVKFTKYAVKVVYSFYQRYQNQQTILTELTKIFVKVLKDGKFYPSQHIQQIRQKCYKILDIIVINYQELKIEVGLDNNELVKLIIDLNDCEKDPRNLFDYFMLVEHLVYRTGILLDDEQVDSIYQKLEIYFPVEFNKRKQDVFVVESDDLERKLVSIFSNKQFIKETKQLVIDNIQSSQDSNNVSAMILVQKMLRNNQSSDLGIEFIRTIWIHIYKTLDSIDQEAFRLLVQQTMFWILWNLNKNKVQLKKEYELQKQIIEQLLELLKMNEQTSLARLVVEIYSKLCEVNQTLNRQIQMIMMKLMVQRVDGQNDSSIIYWCSSLVLVLENKCQKRLQKAIDYDQLCLQRIKEILIFTENQAVVALVIKMLVQMIRVDIEQNYFENLNDIVDQNVIRNRDPQIQKMGVDYFLAVYQFMNHQQQQRLHLFIDQQLELSQQQNQLQLYIFTQLINSSSFTTTTTTKNNNNNGSNSDSIGIDGQSVKDRMFKQMRQLCDDLGNNGQQIRWWISMVRKHSQVITEYITNHGDCFQTLLNYYSQFNSQDTIKLSDQISEHQKQIGSEVYSELKQMVVDLIVVQNTADPNPTVFADQEPDDDHNIDHGIKTRLEQVYENQMEQMELCLQKGQQVDELQCWFIVFLYNSLINKQFNSQIIQKLQSSTTYHQIQFYVELIHSSKFCCLLNKEQKNTLKLVLQQFNGQFGTNDLQLSIKMTQIVARFDLEIGQQIVVEYLKKNSDDLSGCQFFLENVMAASRFSKHQKFMMSIFQSYVFKAIEQIYNVKEYRQQFKMIYLLMMINSPIQGVCDNKEDIVQLVFEALQNPSQLILIQSLKLINKIIINKQFSIFKDKEKELFDRVVQKLEVFKETKDCVVYLNCLQLLAEVLGPLQIGGNKPKIVKNVEKYRGHKKRMVRKLAVYTISRWHYI